MKQEEEIAYRFLSQRYAVDVQYEPDGNVSPDFLIGADLAIEVRRLNKHHWQDGQPKGIESLACPLRSTYRDVLHSFDQNYAGASYWVYFRFKRPLLSTMKEVKQEIRSALQQYLDFGAGQEKTISVNRMIELSIMPSTPTSGRVFKNGGAIDRDRGGWPVSVYTENLRHCIIEKSAKIGKVRSRYPFWWLLLVDHIGWVLDEAEAQEVINGVGGVGEFNRVIVVDRTAQYCLCDIRA